MNFDRTRGEAERQLMFLQIAMLCFHAAGVTGTVLALIGQWPAILIVFYAAHRVAITKKISTSLNEALNEGTFSDD